MLNKGEVLCKSCLGNVEVHCHLEKLCKTSTIDRILASASELILHTKNFSVDAVKPLQSQKNLEKYFQPHFSNKKK